MKKRIKAYYKESFEYIKEIRINVYIIILLFILSTLFGFFFSSELSFIDEFIREIVSKTSDLNSVELMIFIMQNNILSAFISMIFGVFFGIIPVMNSVINGAVLGYVFSKVFLISGFNDFWRILPHGIFELPAIFLALGMGLNLGTGLFSRDAKEKLKKKIYLSSLTFLIVIIPLLILAAIIEGILIFFFT